jgi:VanZ family protein
MTIIKKYYLTLLWAVVIMVLCLLPQKTFPHSGIFELPNLDKVVHFFLFFILSSLLANEHALNERKITSLLVLFLICTGYGFTTEICQKIFTTDRHFEWLDGLTDGIGSLAGLLLSYRIQARYLHK